MQETILNTKNLTVMSKQVNDILLAEQPVVDDENTTQLKIAGVILGNTIIVGFSATLLT